MRPALLRMKITEDVRKYAAEQGISDEQAINEGLANKAREFVAQGSDVYTSA